MADNSPQKAAKKPQARSRITNGKLGANIDGRSTWARRARDLAELYANDLGGADSLSEMQLGLVKRAAVMTVELERAEDGFAKAGEADQASLSAYQTTVNSLRRLLETLGLQAKHTPKDVREVEKSIAQQRLQHGYRIMPHGLDNVSEDKRELFDQARRIAFVIAKAKAEGTVVSAEFAKLAVDLALANEGDLVVVGPDAEGAIQ
jgi:hypothetical protein